MSCVISVVLAIFFFKQKTAYEIKECDWSSDVCSSDLCDITTRELDCVMVGCFGNLRGREGSFKDYPADEPLDLVGVIHCGGCPTAVGSDRIWQKVQALVDYGIDSLHLSSCLIQLCPFKDAFLETIKRDYPDLKVVEGKLGRASCRERV